MTRLHYLKRNQRKINTEKWTATAIAVETLRTFRLRYWIIKCSGLKKTKHARIVKSPSHFRRRQYRQHRLQLLLNLRHLVQLNHGKGFDLLISHQISLVLDPTFSLEQFVILQLTFLYCSRASLQIEFLHFRNHDFATEDR